MSHPRDKMHMEKSWKFHDAGDQAFVVWKKSN